MKNLVAAIIAWPEKVHALILVAALVGAVAVIVSQHQQGVAALIMVAALGIISGVHLVGTCITKSK